MQKSGSNGNKELYSVNKGALESMGCLLGVSMAQFRINVGDGLNPSPPHPGYRGGLLQDVKRAQNVGELAGTRTSVSLTRLYMEIVQGLALIGWVQDAPAVPRRFVNAALATLETA